MAVQPELDYEAVYKVNSDISRAIRTGITELLRKLFTENKQLIKSADLSGGYYMEESFLGNVVGKNNPALVEVLLQLGVNPNAKPHRSNASDKVETVTANRTVLHDAIQKAVEASSQVSRKKAEEIIKMLIKAGADVNAKLYGQSSPLFLAENDPKIVQILLEGGANINERSPSGKTIDEVASPAVKVVLNQYRTHPQRMALMKSSLKDHDVATPLRDIIAGYALSPWDDSEWSASAASPTMR